MDGLVCKNRIRTKFWFPHIPNTVRATVANKKDVIHLFYLQYFMCDVYNDWHRIMGIDTRAEKEDESV